MANIQPRFDPFRSLARFDPLQEMEDFFREGRWSPMLRRFGSESGIRMDITENDQNYVVKAEIPGVSKEDIKVAIDGNQVSISTETRQEREQKEGENLICNERYYGQMSRNFTLPQDVEDTKAEAHYQNGVLELTLPKKEGGGRKQIAIQ
ncbi:MAG: Hsp20/alpha crystallin family protein [Burkholderiales bacterium]|nr:Hsp20/alpha crystallin family protein [Burkholderiales bacterium]